MLDKIERITGCDTMTIDGKAYTRADNSKIEINRKDGTALNSCKVTLRESDNDTNLYMGTSGIVHKMGTAYDTQYFYVRDITYSSGPLITRQVRKIFQGQRQFLDYLNGYFRDAYGLTGTFGITADGQYGFKAATDAEWTLTTGITITEMLPYGIKYEVQALGAENTLECILAVTSGTYAVDYGDGTALGYAAITTTATITKNYTTDKKYEAIICVDDVDDIDLDTSENIIKGIGGDLPPSLADYTLTDNVLKYVRGDMFRYVTSASFSNIDLSGNSLVRKSLDTLIKSIYNNLTEIAGASIVLNGQTPATGPSEQVVDILLPQIIANGNSVSLD
jgi:hypothetical protein